MRFDCQNFGQNCAKGLLMGLNALSILLALCTVSFAAFDARIIKHYGEEKAVGTLAGDIIIICICLILVVVAGLGCVGAVRENVRMLYMYVGLLMILVIIEMMTAIFISVQRYGLELRVTNWLRDEFFKNVTDIEVESHKLLWDDLQISYECCGLNGPEDYPAIHQEISLSCCPRAFRARTSYAQKQLYKACVNSSSYYSKGCEDEIMDSLREGAECLLVISMICFWFEALGLCLSMWMANNIRRGDKVYQLNDFKYTEPVKN